jgi:transposase
MSTAASPSDPIRPDDVAQPTSEQPTSEQLTFKPPTFEELPNEVDTLKRMIVELVVTVHRERLDKEALRHRIALLVARLYGKRTESINPDQLSLFTQLLDELVGEQGANAVPPDVADEEASAAKKKKRRCRSHGRGILPDNLPRRPLHHELCEAERICVCGHQRVDIGTDVSEQLDWQPASVFIVEHFIHKYACPHCRGKSADELMTAPCHCADDATSDAAAPITICMNTSDADKTDAGASKAGASKAGASKAGASKADASKADASKADAANAATANAAPADTSTLSVANQAGVTSAAPKIGAAVISARLPAMPIAKGLPGAGLLAQVIVSKYFDHLPLHRQQAIFARQGVALSRSTLCDWMAASAEVLRPLYDMMVSQVLKSAWLHTDDTKVKNLGHQPGTTALSRFWIYWGDRAHPYNVFDFTINRTRDGPQKFLADFRGYLHADAFSGYDALYLPASHGPPGAAAPIIEVACNAHARRKFHEARGTDVLRSHLALAYYRQLYRLERGADDAELDDEGRLRMRQELSKPILEKFHAWLVEQRPQVLPKSPMAEAINYALNNWAALIRYLDAGFLKIDNNTAEREMKRIAIGRKNWLFVGSDKGGRTASILYSFTSTCHRLKIEPWTYLRDVLTLLPTLRANPSPDRLVELLPDRWQANRQPAGASAAQ